MKKNILLKTNLFICIVIVLGFIITSVISYHSNKGIFMQDVERVSMLTSEGIYHEIDSIFTKPINVSLTMANDHLLKEFLSKEIERMDDKDFIKSMRDYLYAYREKYAYDSVFLVSTKTNRYYHFNGLDRTLTTDNPENTWYYTFLKSDEEYALNIDNDEAANNEITVFINCKIKDSDGSTMGIVGVGFRVDGLQALLKEYENKFDVQANLIDQDGMIEISTDQTGYQKSDLFQDCAYSQLKDRILKERENTQSFWYSSQEKKGYLVTKYVPNLGWHLIIDYDTSELSQKLSQQFLGGVMVIVIVILFVLFTITRIVRKYNERIIELTVEKQKHHAIFWSETEKLYENIYELDITHNCAASKATENYLESLGVPKNTPYDKAIEIIANKQIMEEYRDGYITTFSSANVIKNYWDGNESLCYDFMITNDSVSYYWMRITARIFYWSDDCSIRMFIYRQNIDAEKRKEKQMVEQLQMDSLSGLYNKAATQKYIQEKLQRISTTQGYAFLMLDIDNFKYINDHCGHAIGDLVIADFARTLKFQFQETDIVGRIGGDEFVVFLPITTRNWIEQKAKELVTALRYEFQEGSEVCKISSSIGIAIAPECGDNFETLYKNADAALYRAKARGKNCFVLYSN